MIANRPGHGDSGDDVGVGHLDRLQPDASIINEDGVSGLDVSRQPLEGGRRAVLISVHVVSGDGEGLAEGEINLAFGEVAQPDLGALKVGQQPDRLTQRSGGGAGLVKPLLVLGMVAMTHVESCDIKPRTD